jgi:glutaredoxin
VNERVLTLYGRAGCHLCEDMAAAFDELFGKAGVALRSVDVDSDAALAARFGASVPLLFDGEREICRYHLDPAAVRAWLTEVC